MWVTTMCRSEVLRKLHSRALTSSLMVTDMLSPSQKILIESIHIAGRDAKLGQDYEGVTVQV